MIKQLEPVTILFDLLKGLASARHRPSAAGNLEIAPAKAGEPQKYVWQRLGSDGAGDVDADRYETERRDAAVELLAFAPRFALDVGCHSGSAAVSIKDAFPECRLWGIEPNFKAAELARAHMERVIVDKLDAVDWGAQGVRGGDIDTVFLLDVLEHMYNPWRALESLRGLLAPQGQIVISLPNVRNAFVIRDLMNGYWRYRDFGLLDSTHIRFFSHHEALRLIYQTGFRVERHNFLVSVSLAAMYEEMQDRPFPQRLDFEKGSLQVETVAELRELLATQHMFLVRPARRDELRADEAAFLEAPHPPTFAQGGDRAGTL